MFETKPPANSPPLWQVAALCRAIADALEARFNPVAVRGEVSGYSRAPSGHCYFTLKDPDAQNPGQLRCAMFRRAAGLLNFEPANGQLVELRGRLDVYGPRGELQLIVESMSRAGPGKLFEEFLKLKAKLQAEGLFEASRKRPLPLMPRGIGVVTSLNAAALADVLTALKRRLPHVPVWLAPATVQGANAPGELIESLLKIYQTIDYSREQTAKLSNKHPQIDVILLVRGGGSMDDLAAFNDERLARTIAQSPVPVISGVGHETDFSIADFVADLRAPTPTAAAELVAQPQSVWLNLIDTAQGRLQDAVLRELDAHESRLQSCAARIARPSLLVQRHRLRLDALAARQKFGLLQNLKQTNDICREQSAKFRLSLQRGLWLRQQKLDHAQRQLELLDPRLVLQRGYAWLTDAAGQAITQAAQAQAGQQVRATLSDGSLDLRVLPAPKPGISHPELF